MQLPAFSRRTMAVLAGLIVLAFAMSLFELTAYEKEDEAAEMADLADLAAEKKIVVYVSGAVARPGVVRLAENARAYEAVEACGGVLPNADMAAVNLAQPLKDGMQVNVAAVAVKEENSPRPKKESESAALININTADSETLMKLNGVGKATAAAIIEYRKREGSFRSIEDLKKVSGIGEKKFERISSQVTL